MIVIPGGMPFDLTYRTNDDGSYIAHMLTLDPAIEPRGALSDEMTSPQWLPHAVDVAEPRFRQSLEQAMAAIHQHQELPDVIAVHHVLEVIRWIELKGGWACAPCDRSMSGRIWNIFANEPARDWSPDEVAGRLGLSVTRLRNSTHDEGASFSQLLHEMRMSHALSLLLTTNMPIYVVGREIGYRSAPRFTIRFQERYGLLPGDVRGHDRPIRSRNARLPLRLPSFPAAVPARYEPGPQGPAR